MFCDDAIKNKVIKEYFTCVSKYPWGKSIGRCSPNTAACSSALVELHWASRPEQRAESGSVTFLSTPTNLRPANSCTYRTKQLKAW